MGPIRILIADDHPLLRNRIRQILSADTDLIVLAEAGTAGEVMKVLLVQPIDLIILDMHMPGPGGLKLMEQIHQVSPDVKTIILTALSEGFIKTKMLEAGAAGFISKENASDELVPEIRKIFVSRES
jgi:two-component system, NarL family, invasion response regulator UvrY